MNYQPRLKKEYIETIRKELKDELGLDNIMSVPKLSKIVINVGLGEAKNDSKILDDMVEDISLITSQRPVKTKAKKAISNFKIRAGQEIGLKVTLRGDLMWEFYDRLVNIVLPRVKDFRGVSSKTFDGNGNYSLGIQEHTIFPEIDTSRVVKPKSMQIVIVVANADNKRAEVLLKKLGMPFAKSNKLN